MQKQNKQNIIRLPQLRTAMAHVPLHEMNQGFFINNGHSLIGMEQVNLNLNCLNNLKTFYVNFKTSRCIGKSLFFLLMAKINPMTHIDSMNGKYAQTDQVYTKIRKFDEQVIGVRMKHPATNEPPTEAQQAVQTKFTNIIGQVNTALADSEQKATLTKEWKAQKRCKTLRGYVFSKLSKNLNP